MNNAIILAISLIILVITFLIIILIVSKKKIQELLVPLDVSKEQINNYLKQKYLTYKDIIAFLIDNVNIKENAFEKFLEFDTKECIQSELIDILDETTMEINEYIDKFEEISKNEDFLKLKKTLYNIQVNLEATIEYYNSKITVYNNLKENGPTSLATKLFIFDDYSSIKNEKGEVSRLINLN